MQARTEAFSTSPFALCWLLQMRELCLQQHRSNNQNNNNNNATHTHAHTRANTHAHNALSLFGVWRQHATLYWLVCFWPVALEHTSQNKKQKQKQKQKHAQQKRLRVGMELGWKARHGKQAAHKQMQWCPTQFAPQQPRKFVGDGMQVVQTSGDDSSLAAQCAWAIRGAIGSTQCGSHTHMPKLQNTIGNDERCRGTQCPAGTQSIPQKYEKSKASKASKHKGFPSRPNPPFLFSLPSNR